MKKIATPIFLLLFILFTTKVYATDYYVSVLIGNNSNTGTSPTQAFATIKKAADLTNPGDTVFIMNGTYNPVSNFQQSIVTINRSGAPGAYITYKPFPGHTPKLQLEINKPFQIWRAVAIDASYIVFTGIEIEGTNQLLNYADAYQTWQDYENNIRDWNKISMYNCGSISIGSNAGAAPHHVIVSNCKIYDTGGGIGGFNCDYVTIENNLVYNTCWYSMYAGSGISILDPRSIDLVTTYKIFIRNNVTHNNKTLIPWERINALSDGNGIILDVNTGNGTTTLPYVGRYLVENNLSYNNGGGGVHAYKCTQVDIINNTAYNNGTVVGYPEIDANQCSDVKIYNNIMFARTGGNCNGNDLNTIYNYNVYFNGPSFKRGPHDRIANPQFVAPGTTATANFRLQNTSPAINNGSNISGQFSPTDILGVARPVGFRTDMGAYEHPVVISRPKIEVKQAATEMFNATAFNFGDVSSTAPKTVTFTINNIGDLPLNLTGTPRIIVSNTTGTGFTLTTDAPATVMASGSVTFAVTLSPGSTAANYAGSISIANNDIDQPVFAFPITGYGYDGNKALQTITFPPLPIKVAGSADFNPGATSSAGLAITYTSSNTNLATIVAGQIKLHATNVGTVNITASQAGDATTNPAQAVVQILTVTPVLPPAGTNMLSNPHFDFNTAFWSFAYRLGGVATVSSVTFPGSPTNVGKVVVTNLGTSTGIDNVQLSTRVFLVKDRNYLISFKANADAPRNITLRLLQDGPTFNTLYTVSNIALTTTQSTYGTYAYTSSFTGYVALRFFVATNTIPVYFDDVIMIEEPSGTLPASLLSFTGTLTANKATLNWKTGFELNVHDFVIEKSKDGIAFSSIGKVPAKNISTGSSYSFPDAEAVKGLVYYRLKTIDNDGSFALSNIVKLKGGEDIKTSLKIFPNPVTTSITVSYPVASAMASLRIIHADGKKIANYNVAVGSIQRTIDVSGLASGQYFIIYNNAEQTITSSFIK